MGWESGKGLGANEDGSTTHVKATKRRDNLGKEEKYILQIDVLFRKRAGVFISWPENLLFRSVNL